MAQITITHSRTDGTLIEGSHKGDGVWEALRTPFTLNFRSSRDLGALYLPNSRDKRSSWKVAEAAKRLRAAGFEVDVQVDDKTPGRTAEEIVAEKDERAEDRADRFAERAQNATRTGEALIERNRETLGALNGTPILVGHHSEGRHRRLLERIDARDRRAIGELKRGEYWGQRAESAAASPEHRVNPTTVRNRIERLEAQRRDLERKLAGTGSYRRWVDGEGHVDSPAVGEYRDVVLADIAGVDDQLDYNRGLLLAAEANGVKIWRQEDINKGDFVLYYRIWFEVIRANPKSITVPFAFHVIGSGKFSWTAAEAREKGYTSTDKMRYTDVKGVMTAEEMAAKLAEPAGA